MLSFFIALGVLIFVHEFGHFIQAKRAGIYVEEFSWGFGPRLFGIKRGETDYRVSLLPLGGYVKMRGEDSTDDFSSDPRAFCQKSLWKRFLVIFSGPFMNLLLCLFLMPLVFMLGRTEPVYLEEPPVVMGVWHHSPAEEASLIPHDRILSVNGTPTPKWEDVLQQFLLTNANNTQKPLTITLERDHQTLKKILHPSTTKIFGIEPDLFIGNEPIIGKVFAGSAASTAGVKEGDRILAMQGESLQGWSDLPEIVNKTHGNPVKLTLERAGKISDLIVKPVYDQHENRYLLGVQKKETKIPMLVKKYTFFPAIQKGFNETVKLSSLTLDIVKRLVTLKLSYKVLGGPIMIAKTSAAAAKAGLSDFLYFLSFLSVQLAFLNLLPIPVLDGGHLLFLAVEGIRRKPVNPRIRQVATNIGFGLLLILMVTVTVNDIRGLFSHYFP